MKNTFLLAAVLASVLGFSNKMNAQTKAATDVHWEVRAGLGAAYASHIAGSDGLPSWHIGVMGDVGLWDGGKWRLLVGLRYAQKGWDNFGSFDTDPRWDDVDFETRLHYLNVPVLAAYRLKVGRRVSIVPQAGPYFGVGIVGKTRAIDYGGPIDDVYRNHFGKAIDFEGLAYDERGVLLSYPKFHRLDMGVHAGIDVEIKRFVVGAMAEASLTTVAGSPLNKTHLFTFGLDLGYRF